LNLKSKQRLKEELPELGKRVKASLESWSNQIEKRKRSTLFFHIHSKFLEKDNY
jgi:hypothetical protein